MASKKDLLDAQSFSRRRLLTAFTSGAPGGKELEPARPLRAVATGVALAVMVVLGGLFYGLMRPGLADGWDNNTVILVKDSGARYLSIDGTLYPVLNATSARLLVPSGEYRVITVDASAIKNVPVAPTVGILGAPDDLPDASSLVGDGWTACPAGQTTAVSLPGSASATTSIDAALVTSDDALYVVVGSYRYPVDSGSDDVLRQLGLTGVRAVPVDSRWLNLFQAGSPLAPLVIEGAGDNTGNANLPVGAVVHPQGSADRFVITADHELAPISDLAYQLYFLGTGIRLGGEREVTPGEIASLPTANQRAGAADWPTGELRPLQDGSSPCALLTHDARGLALTTLAVTTSPPAQGGITITPHAGALVLATGQGAQTIGEIHVIDDSGTSFAVPHADDEILARLGYTTDHIAQVPLVWTEFFPAGPPLTVEAAGTTPNGESLGIIPTGGAPASGTPLATPEPPGSETNAVTDTAIRMPEHRDGGSADSLMADGHLPGIKISDTTGDQRCEPGVYTYSPELPQALNQLQSSDAWTVATGRGVVVAVVDSGIDAANEHLQDAFIGGVNLVGDGERVDGGTDVYGHGTAIAGVIAARSVDGSGVVGLAPDAALLSVRVFRATDEESIKAGFGPDPARVARGIVWAVDNGADVINVSLSDDVPSAEIEAAVSYADSHGVLVVASAGNRTTTNATDDSPRYPAAFPGALAVAAADPAGYVTESSIHGPHVQVSAPGQAVTTATTGGGDCTYASTAPSSSYSTGYVSAAAALIAQAYPNETPEQWAYRLMASALRSDPDMRDDLAGWGFIQPFDALMLQPGTGQRGPVSPFVSTMPVIVNPPGVSASTHHVTSPWDRTMSVALTSAVVGVLLLAGLGVLFMARKEPNLVSMPQARRGLLDKHKDSATRIVPKL